MVAAASTPEPHDLRPIETVDLSSHLAGQDSPGPLRYTIFRDASGPVGVLWMAAAPGDEAAGWESRPEHPDADRYEATWRLRITVAQARSAAPDGDGTYTAEQFFRLWTEERPPEDNLVLDGPHEFDGSAERLVTHLGW